MLSMLCLREREEETFRSVVDKLKVMGPIRAILDLQLSELPDPSTVCKAMDRVTMTRCRRLLRESVTLFELGDVTAIDASGFDRVAASRRYARRIDYRFLAMKTTVLTDCFGVLSADEFIEDVEVGPIVEVEFNDCFFEFLVAFYFLQIFL